MTDQTSNPSAALDGPYIEIQVYIHTRMGMYVGMNVCM